MKYFETCIEGGCYDEFVSGVWDKESFWSENSLYLYDDIFDELRLYENVFSKAFEVYDRWGPNRVTRDDWYKICALARECGGAVEDLFDELAPWAEDNFAEYEEFWILGI